MALDLFRFDTTATVGDWTAMDAGPFALTIRTMPMKQGAVGRAAPPVRSFEKQ